jgi:hypothetical protein
MSPVLPAPDVVVRAARRDDHAASLVFEAAPHAYTAVAGSESRARAAIGQLWRLPGHSASFEHALVAELDGRLVGVMIGFPARPGRVTMGRVIGRAVADYATSRLSRRPRSAGHLFTPTHARVVIDGREVPTDTHNALHAGAFDVNLGGVLRVFPLAREPGAVHFQAGAIPPAQMIANLPALIAGRAIRSAQLRDVSGREMVIEAAQQPLSPIIDGERFTDITRLVVRAGPNVRIAVPGSLSRQ